jgi:RNA polymerase-binding transcription factor
VTDPRPTSRSSLPPDREVAAVLAAERAATSVTVADLAREVDRMVAASVGTNADDEHDPEGATIAFERAQLQSLLARARDHLTELDEAADRLAAGTYGTCAGCGQPIAPARLAALPATTTCIACARR